MITEETKAIIRELYKAHFNAKETAQLTNIPYQKITAIFRGFAVANISKYDRLVLSPILSYNTKADQNQDQCLKVAIEALN